MLSAGAGGAVNLHFNVLRTNLDLHVVVDFRDDFHSGEGGVPAGVRIKWGDAHQTVYAGLAL